MWLLVRDVQTILIIEYTSVGFLFFFFPFLLLLLFFLSYFNLPFLTSELVTPTVAWPSGFPLASGLKHNILLSRDKLGISHSLHKIDLPLTPRTVVVKSGVLSNYFCVFTRTTPSIIKYIHINICVFILCTVAVCFIVTVF